MRPALIAILIACAGVSPTRSTRGQDGSAERIEALKKEVAAGAINKGFLRAFEAYALHEVKTAGVLREDLAQWIEGDPIARRTAAWTWARIPDPSVFARLDRLWEQDSKGVQRRPNLAFGIAAAWRHGTRSQPAREWESWTGGRDDIPTIEQSFRWYLSNERALHFPIQKATWIELAFTGLNDVPIAERDWVIERYRGTKLPRLRDAFAEVPYIDGGLDGQSKTLQNMVAHGGVCTVNTQYGMSVMRTLGFPATFGGGPGHCWPCWIEPDGRDRQFARRNELGNRDGTLGQWVTDELRYESDLRRLSSALSISADGLMKADCAAAAARTVSTEGTTRLLVDAIDKNRLSACAWIEFARQVRLGIADEYPTQVLLKRLPRALSEHLDFAARCMRETQPTGPDEGTRTAGSEGSASDWLRCCSALIRHARDSGRDDLVSTLASLRATTTEQWVPPEIAFRTYRDLSMEAAEAGDRDSLESLLRSSLAVARRSAALPDQAKLLRTVAAKSESARCKRLASSHLWKLLYETGESDAADRLRLEALSADEPAPQEHLSDDYAKSAAGGGGGGASFLDHAAQRQVFVGLRYSVGDWNGITVIASVRPMFRDRSGNLVPGELHGSIRGEEQELVASGDREVVGLAITSGDMVDGFALVFAPTRNGKARLKDAEFSPWCGGSDRDQKLLGGRGKQIVGLHGRAGDLLDALGLVTTRR